MATESSKGGSLQVIGEGNLSLVTSPHAHFGWSTARIMWTVSLSLVPCLASAVWFFGAGVLAPVAGAVIGAAATEWVVARLNHKPQTLPDGSAFLTGLLLGLIVPPGFSPLHALLGGVVSIGIGKAVFGGLGDNIFNPALVGRAFLQASFPAGMTDWSASVARVDAVSQATPLGLYKFGDPSQFASDIATQKLLVGNVGGCLGETSAVAILAGAAILLVTRIAHWQIMVSMVLGGFVFGGVLHLGGVGPSPLFHVLSGGFLFGAVFMATDYVTSPTTPRGQWIFGLGIALLTILIREFGGLPEGVMYSILMMNAAVPLINRGTRPRIYGAKR
ncbi:MAG TPA: RnfABCDGE type electron transport complex subunit D [Candidatus Krumholzibacteria bacterium]|nr:RnfABCDGE type electron transport complex subunit D [Candidatus Krumholzibacteria bacterium]HPD70510.1 RnfABCDGE type electron transport complex subunit D [Candidatus Krumholzibacteria bacterium]HRY39790.1 RnfABCDGE type electron transport complex subunit D [Candidatus Krumholzibacteria bacterium]